MSTPAPPCTFDRRDLRNALGVFATGVTVVTTIDAAGRCYAMTANSFTAVSLSPPLVLWSVARDAYSAAAFTGSRYFAINVLALDQIPLSRHFSRPSDDKFAGIATFAGEGGCPLIAGAAAAFQCSTESTHPAGDHEIIIGRIRHYRYSAQDPLIFCRGRYQKGLLLEFKADAEAELNAAWGGLA